MSASVAPATTDRSDFRTVMVSGTKMGALTAAAGVLFLVVARFVPGTGGARRGLGTLTRTAGPAVVGAVLLVIVARLAGLQLALPVETGAGFTIALAVLAVVALARKS